MFSTAWSVFHAWMTFSSVHLCVLYFITDIFVHKYFVHVHCRRIGRQKHAAKWFGRFPSHHVRWVNLFLVTIKKKKGSKSIREILCVSTNNKDLACNPRTRRNENYKNDSTEFIAPGQINVIHATECYGTNTYCLHVIFMNAYCLSNVYQSYRNHILVNYRKLPELPYYDKRSAVCKRRCFFRNIWKINMNIFG